MIHTTAELISAAEGFQRGIEKQDASILVCAGTGCAANGSLEVFEALRQTLKTRGLHITIDYLLEDGCHGITTVKSGCHGFCEMGPLVRLEPSGYLYTKVVPSDAADIVDSITHRKPVERLLYRHPASGELYATESDIPFYKHQTRVSLKNCGAVDPEDIRSYIAQGGYQGAANALELSKAQVVDEILRSRLRGRGGGGFPTGRKWSIAADTPADQKYVICNGDEGDPGAFMDRSVMEGDPHRVLEGLLIAGYAVGADTGYIYVRAEYPLAVERLRKAITDAEAMGLLGSNILNSGFSFRLHVKEGAGAFVCGEESALIASIEGQRGMPRPKPPFPAVAGLWGKPTVINNVETLACIPDILRRGAAWFAGIGTPSSPGTKTFALTGEVGNTGLIEVPMGATLRDVVYKIGGGIRNDGTFKAVQIGGPSGGCLTEEHLDLPLDFDSLQQAGAMIGSGGLVVMDQNTCIVEVARFFMNFTQYESCGKCVLCREGTKRMLEILQAIVEGRGKPEHLDHLREIGHAVQVGSLCGLGKTAPNPVLTTMEFFADEYHAHVVEKRCPAGVCQGLKRYEVVTEDCRGCSKCARMCPVQAITGQVKQPYVIDRQKCIACGACVSACKFGAIQEVA